jgi:hypothetical protein
MRGEAHYAQAAGTSKEKGPATSIFAGAVNIGAAQGAASGVTKADERPGIPEALVTRSVARKGYFFAGAAAAPPTLPFLSPEWPW